MPTSASPKIAFNASSGFRVKPAAAQTASAAGG